MSERLTGSPEYKLPIIEAPANEQIFTFNGFIKGDNKLLFDITYEGPDRLQGVILRSAIDDGYTYRAKNRIDWDRDNPDYVDPLPEYETGLYRPIEVGLYHKELSLEQISTFADLVNQMIKEKGLENITQDDIFKNDNVRNILGLNNLEDPFAYTPVKKKSRRGVRRPKLGQKKGFGGHVAFGKKDENRVAERV